MNMNNPKLLTALRGPMEAPLHGPNDCSADTRSRRLSDRATAVSPKHAEPFHLRSASNTQRTCRSAGFDFQARRTLS
ncbi:hypothetical protein K469DRAFT_714196 [Zopfia rhizophila CBS 207.26]|uniref:Uncharacterized protein n=1 Tax=Zopfia rhizophila CBS 207.26 TaxID=1314779 RepID=A0A6A6DSP1_9PEZI|nr:hypothetical protein K469DRAFT_714196 [Zopfia rhizophila CBS 207.26]